MNSAPRLTTYSAEELLAFAREHVPFYRQAYAGLPEKLTLAQVPVIDQKSYWNEHTRDPRGILGLPLRDGIVLNSGGSTGEPKFSYFNDEEWDSAVALETRALEEIGLHEGDRVANLFASGYLYSSFLLMSVSLKATSARVLQVPIGFFAAVPDAARLLRTLDVNVLAGVPSHLLAVLDYIQKHHVEEQKLADIRLTRILFAGEPFTTGQREYLQKRFPGVQIFSLGYASVDGGIIGFADAGCGPGEHRVFDGATILEILDEETGEPIEEAGVPGNIVFTNLTRRLMPMLRYPTGDRAQWVESPSAKERQFLLMGRSEEGARLAAFTVQVAEVAVLLEPFRESLGIRQFQLVVTQHDLRDLLTVRIVGTAGPEEREAAGQRIAATFLKQKPALGEMVAKGIVNPVAVEWVEAAQLEVNERTGKTRKVVDRRLG